MKKSVYSLVLSDEVVEAIDRLAYRNGTNRSGFVNRILAQYVSYQTPEMRFDEIFRHIEAALCADDAFQLLCAPSDTMLSLRSALSYKYHPTVRYSVSLCHTEEGTCEGELRVSLRTQNVALIGAMQGFYLAWVTAEKRLLGSVEYTIERDRFTRTIRDTANGEKTLEARITHYIRVFDTALKAYFDRLESPAEARNAVERIYLDSFSL